MDLFSHQREQLLQRQAPLAERMRPLCLKDFIGQDEILGAGRLLRRAIEADCLGSIIFHGPPGTGKTSLARIIANSTRSYFCSLNAVLAGIRELKDAIEQAQEKLGRHGLRTLLFIDEVHRFNKSQQDALLPWVENGTVTLIGATTENPFFEVNKALVSRSRLFRLQPLTSKHLDQVICRALSDQEMGFGNRNILISIEARSHLIAVAGGDARTLLNALELAVESSQPDNQGLIEINLEVAEQSIQQQAVLYDKQGDAHFDTISAFIKSIRGSDPDAALFWLARMIEAGEDPRFIFRRLLIAAGEDIGLADPQGIVVVEACAAAFDRIGLPEGIYPLVQATLYLTNTSKSNSILGFFDAVRSLKEEKAQLIPSHLRDSHRDGAAFGDGKGYRYPHAYSEHWVAQQYLPETLQGQIFWQPGKSGWEAERSQQLQWQRAAQLSAAAEWGIEQGESVSSSPSTPSLERWLKRQMVQAGERLQLLQQRFWQGIPLERHHRVLVLNCQSLFWALPAMKLAPEGGVSLQVENRETATKLEAQLQVLDQLQKPIIYQTEPHCLDQLHLQLQEGEKFELIIGRNLLKGATPSEREKWLNQLDLLLTEDGRLTFLNSHRELGPLNLLPKGSLGWVNSLQIEMCQLEKEWLNNEAFNQPLENQLKSSGWVASVDKWLEQVEFIISPQLLEQWFNPESKYRCWWLNNFAAELLTELENCYQHQLGVKLIQPLIHQCLTAQKNPASMRGFLKRKLTDQKIN
ncbi:MAG: AAA family ATPase [Cyanobacteria bacterium]|nr:AAA family ATPase [Cyanobacteriota bacterium]